MKALIFGAGKIARGFIAQLLKRSGYEITFVDVNRVLKEALDKKGKYYVNVMGNEKESEWIKGFHFVHSLEIEEIASAMLEADIAFSSVGGKNLSSLAKTIAQAFTCAADRWGEKELSLITCENWKNPAAQLEGFILENLSQEWVKELFQKRVGVSEAAILRSGIEPSKNVLAMDENAVSVTDYWELPLDADRLKGELPKLQGVCCVADFDRFLQRKIYTFNTTNATIAYIGILKGYRYLADAANDPEICEILGKVHREMNPAIAAALGVELPEQEAFAEKAKRKYQDRSVVDFLERHGRDPIRKLGPEDRIVGTARLMEGQGVQPDALALTLAAAIFYRSSNEGDESAGQLEKMRKEEGVTAVLEKVCRIQKDEPLAGKVFEKIEELKKRGWLYE